ncbi:ABC transporter substrate-binding protein [Amycolatopsis sp. NPDC005232]|uniref:ABC transporter substrate-binding protein n=1 Tax=Amycolatopsis sp. NPDC005232 TaxID=3157027 RepID=UPI0033B46898
MINTSGRPVVVAVPDLVSPSYFPAIAAVELGFAREEGIHARLDLMYPPSDAAEALRDGKIDLLAGPAHSALHAFPGWRGAKLVMALSRNTYWFLVMRTDLGIARGDLAALHNVRIGAALGPDLAFRAMLAEADVDTETENIEVVAVPGTDGPGTSFGVVAAKALADGKIDGFWANGMGTAVAVREGVGTIVVDARRDGRPTGLAGYTFPGVAVTEESIKRQPENLAAMTRAIRRTQQRLREDPEQATVVGNRLFPELEATMIAELIRRDAPFYEPEIDRATERSLIAFARRAGILDSEDCQVVAPGF